MNVHPGKSGKRIPVTDATKERWQWSPRIPLWQRMLQRISQWFGGSVEGRTLQRVPIAARQRSLRRSGK